MKTIEELKKAYDEADDAFMKVWDEHIRVSKSLGDCKNPYQDRQFADLELKLQNVTATRMKFLKELCTVLEAAGFEPDFLPNRQLVW